MRLVRLLLVLAAVSTAFAGDVSSEALKTHVFTLASKEFGGRRGPGARKAEEYIRKAFLAAGLETSIQELPAPKAGPAARNVIGIRRAGDKPTKEHVIVSAHYDHLGRWGEFVFPGASDNAAGVAAMLEIARLLTRPERDVIFIAFDLEEVGLRGSTRYTHKPVRPLAECAAFVTFDILGRDLMDATRGLLFCTGTERSDSLIDVVRKAKKPEGLQVLFAGADMVGRRSDFAPFMDKQVPFLFFSTGENRDYHQPTDTPDKIDLPKLAREATVLLDISRRVAAAPRAKFLAEPACRMDEVSSLAIALNQLLQDPKKLSLTKTQVGLGNMLKNYLGRIEAKGNVTKEERFFIVKVGQQLTR